MGLTQRLCWSLKTSPGRPLATESPNLAESAQHVAFPTETTTDCVDIFYYPAEAAVSRDWGSPRTFNHSLGRERNMADAQQRGQADTDELNALQARVDYAKSLVDWVNQAPQPPQPQTAAKTLNETLGEIVGELARIRACYDIKEAREWLTKNNFKDDPDPERAKWWEDMWGRVEDEAKEANCPGAS
jgi:hypothetical protein